MIVENLQVKKHQIFGLNDMKPTMKHINRIALLLVLVVAVFACVEPYELKTEEFESALVISATITNEFKQHEISLTRSFMFEEDGPSAERNANVQILVEDQGSINFEEDEDGIYRSTEAFSAEANKNYELKITTNNGDSYSSLSVRLTGITGIDNINAVRRANPNGIDGVALLVDSFDPSGNSVNYRYEYEETYKIIAPHWSNEELYVISRDTCIVGLRFRQQEERICYTTDVSNSILLTSTRSLTEDRVTEFPVRFIKNDNYILSYRYSILVKQFVISSESYAFFETLNELSGSESLFSQNQPGFLSGNIFSDNNKNEHVIGFFDVSSVDEKRIYFNYEDFYPNQSLPPYIIQCNYFAPAERTIGGCPLTEQVADNSISYVEPNPMPKQGEGPHWVVKRPCGDCTELGSVDAPDFWID